MGSVLPGFFAVKIGSENLLFATLPIYIALTAAYFWMLKHTDTLPKNTWENESSWQQGFELIKSSKYLTFILLIVLFMQISSTIVYYQFNTILETTIGDKDMRTEYCGRVLGIVNSLTIGLQFFGSFLLVHFLGLRASHLLIPCALSINAIGCLLVPTFPMISYAYITIKACDFSIFGIIKEMLYIPLKLDEKFHAKAIIDVFAYRTAKAFASFLILFFQFVHTPFSLLSWSSIILFGLWSFIVLRMYQLKEETVA
jgi:ATP/ADP translocase